MVTSHKPRLSDTAPPSAAADVQLRWDRHGAEEVPYRPRHAARLLDADPKAGNWATSPTPSRRGRHAARGQSYRPAPRERGLGLQGVIPDPRAGEDTLRERQLAGLNALLALASATAATHPFPVLPLAPSTQPDVATARPPVLALLKDPALRGALALIFSAAMSGVLGFVFWALTAHQQNASAVGSVSAEVSAIMFLASVGSLSLSNVFTRFLPEAGWNARRMIVVSYSGALLAGSIVAIIFLLTPLASGLVLGGDLGRLAFAVCVVLNSVFIIQDGGLIGFGRTTWVPIENILVALARLALLPLATMFFSAPIGILFSWGPPHGNCGCDGECADHWPIGRGVKAAPKPAAIRGTRSLCRGRLCDDRSNSSRERIPARPGNTAAWRKPRWLFLCPVDHHNDGIAAAQ